MGSFVTSSGERFSKKQIDTKIRKAKKDFVINYTAYLGYHFCSALERNVDEPVDVSHIISVRECQNAGRTEEAWNPDNMQMESRTQHMIWERGFNSHNAIADIRKQKNFEVKLAYIREKWWDKYLIILNKLETHGKVKNV